MQAEITKDEKHTSKVEKALGVFITRGIETHRLWTPYSRKVCDELLVGQLRNQQFNPAIIGHTWTFNAKMLLCRLTLLPSISSYVTIYFMYMLIFAHHLNL